MVKIVRSIPTYPNGIPGLKMKFPFWEDIENVSPESLKGVYRGDIIYFQYNSRVEEDKQINSNPMILFQGVDQNGNILGSNIMFFNKFIDPNDGGKSVHRNYLAPFFDTLKTAHFDEVYLSGVRKPFLKCERRYYSRIFGPKVGVMLDKFWRVYNKKKIVNAMNLNPDSALSIVSSTQPKYKKSRLYIE